MSALRMTSLLACAALLTGRGVHAQDQLDLTIHAHFGQASHIVIPQSAGGRGFVLERRGQAIQVEAVEARVDIVDQTASTTMEIAMRNPGPQQVEAVLLLPVPEGAVVSAFAFEGSASEPTARLLPRDEARRLYDAIVSKVRDPALLEFAGYNLIRSSVFPVAAGGAQRVRLTYEHLLTADGSRVDYLLPRSESLDRRCPWQLSIDIRAAHPISTVYSPSHEVRVERAGPRQASITLADIARNDPGAFRLSYLLERDGNGLAGSFFAYPDPKVGGGGGYFLLMAGAPSTLAQKRPPVQRDVTLVIDRSGSMAGEKMDQAKAAAIQVLEGLAEGEAFNVIDFSTTVAMFAAQPVAINQQTRVQARQYIQSIRPGGGTNIHDALVEALRPHHGDVARLPIVLFMTDGLPTVGQTSEVAIREVVEKGNAQHKRVFAFGVGNDVNVPLLDRIADVSRGTTTYVLPQEDVELKVAAVFKRLWGPVLSDMSLETLDREGKPATRLVRDVIPGKLPDLFEGDQMILLGQYQQEGPITFRVSGSLGAERRGFDVHFDSAKATTANAFVPRLWASRRIAYLVDQIRQAGAERANRPNEVGVVATVNDPRFRELTDEILRLSTEFGILTEYTAFLATEGTDLSDWDRLRAACGTVLDGRAVQTRSGQAAVNQGINYNFQKAKGCSNPNDNRWVDQNLEQVEITSVQQVCDRAFFKRGNQWIDGQLITGSATPGGQQLQAHEIVEYGSAQHLDLLHKLIEQNRQGVLSLDGEIMIQFEGRNILVRNDQTERSN